MATIAGLFPLVKRHLNITWDDAETDRKVEDLIADAAESLCHLLGSDAIDFSAPGRARRLFLAYCLYLWNDSGDEFEKAYISDILHLRHYYEVQADKPSEGAEVEGDEV